MGSGESEPEAFGKEKPGHQVALADYWMAHYPVTVAQFRAFVEASGYKPQDESSLRGLPNHPVVDVTWYDTQAFCEWLTKDWQKKGWLPQGWAVQLPSEAEWEKAARGGVQIANIKCQVSNLKGELGKLVKQQENPKPKRVYPWGDKADPNLANYCETGIGATSVVGCFPGGASPYGCEDMSGNVWEWTRSVYKSYPYNLKDGRESLAPHDAPVFRGGAFHNNDTLMYSSL
jgi:formylglycine-generating enzyme required for sulfatase activity